MQPVNFVFDPGAMIYGYCLLNGVPLILSVNVHFINSDLAMELCSSDTPEISVFLKVNKGDETNKARLPVLDILQLSKVIL